MRAGSWRAASSAARRAARSVSPEPAQGHVEPVSAMPGIPLSRLPSSLIQGTDHFRCQILERRTRWNDVGVKAPLPRLLRRDFSQAGHLHAAHEAGAFRGAEDAVRDSGGPVVFGPWRWSALPAVTQFTLAGPETRRFEGGIRLAPQADRYFELISGSGLDLLGASSDPRFEFQ